jgi:CDGSH-type Zn-finger protein
MAEPVIAQKGPFEVSVTAGKKYWWCACGRSKKQPFCDGSHQGTGFEPLQFSPAKSETMWRCGCKRTASWPSCDGTHGTL